jgi:hypothetical protein
MTCFFLSARDLNLFENRLQFFIAQVIAQLFQMGVRRAWRPECLPRTSLVAAQADGFGLHDFIGHGVFQHAVLVNAGFVGKGIGAHDGFVGLHHDAGDHADQAAGGIDVLGVDAGFERHEILAGVQGHDHLFHGGIAGPFADAVDGHFGLPGAGLMAAWCWPWPAQVVVAVDAENGLDACWACFDRYGGPSPRIPGGRHNPPCRAG